jgi:hypothetical protein
MEGGASGKDDSVTTLEKCVAATQATMDRFMDLVKDKVTVGAVDAFVRGTGDGLVVHRCQFLEEDVTGMMDHRAGHRPCCVDGLAAAWVAYSGLLALGVVNITVVAVTDDLQQVHPPRLAAVSAWVSAHVNGEDGLVHRAVFLDVAPDRGVQDQLLRAWADGSQLRVHVGIRMPSCAMVTMGGFQVRAGPYGMLTTDLGLLGTAVSTVTLAYWWAARCANGRARGEGKGSAGPGAGAGAGAGAGVDRVAHAIRVDDVSVRVLQDITASGSQEREPQPYVTFMQDALQKARAVDDRTPRTVMAYLLKPSEEEYARRCEEGRRLQEADAAEVVALGTAAVARPCTSLVTGYTLYFVKCTDTRKLIAIAKWMWAWLESKHGPPRECHEDEGDDAAEAAAVADTLLMQVSSTEAYVVNIASKKRSMACAFALCQRAKSDGIASNIGTVFPQGGGMEVGVWLPEGVLDGIAAAFA